MGLDKLLLSCYDIVAAVSPLECLKHDGYVELTLVSAFLTMGKGLAQILDALILETFPLDLAGSLWVSLVAIKRANSSADLPLSLSL